MIKGHGVKVESLVEYMVAQERDLNVSSGQVELEGEPYLASEAGCLTAVKSQSIAAISIA